MTPDQASVVRDFLVPHLRAEYQRTRRVIKAVPEEQADYRPSGKCMSAKDLATHLATIDIYFLQSVINGEFGAPDKAPFEGQTIATIVSEYDSRLPALVDRMEALPGEQLAAILKFHSFELPAINFLQIMIVHGVHHRGQLSSYLR
ncbi:MAG TPA: DinB family protein, partial [Bryobacteraceae bacterium]|nr:DinB family protein [Bryobacteraceae bacterium]